VDAICLQIQAGALVHHPHAALHGRPELTFVQCPRIHLLIELGEQAARQARRE
jgi:hypothetical protein